MKILTIVTEAEMGGAQVHVVDLLRGLREQCEVVLAAGDEGYLTASCAELEIPVWRVPSLVRAPHPVKDLRALAALIAVIRSVRPDLVHVHTFKAGFLGRLAAFLCGVPSIYTAHTWCFQPGTGAWWKRFGWSCEWLGARLCARIIAVSEANRQLALTAHVSSPQKIQTVPNGVRDLALRADPGEPVRPRLMMVARFVPQKDQLLLLDALAGIGLPWTLQFVGEGPTLETVRERARKLGLADRVEFLGRRADVPHLLATAHIFVLTTHLEGLPLGILEAMRAGLPIVASAVGGIPESIESGHTGFLVPHGDQAALRRALEELVCKPEVRARMGLASRRKFEREFQYETMLARTMNLYQEAVPQKRSGAGLQTADRQHGAAAKLYRVLEPKVPNEK